MARLSVLKREAIVSFGSFRVAKNGEVSLRQKQEKRPHFVRGDSK